MHIAALWRGAVLAAAFATVTAPAGCGALISSSTRSSFVGATMGPS